jgi:hypothetical protein
VTFFVPFCVVDKKEIIRTKSAIFYYTQMLEQQNNKAFMCTGALLDEGLNRNASMT